MAESAAKPEMLSGKSAIILGASRGIGEAIARAFVAQGASVVLGARNLPLLRKIADEIDPSGTRTRVIAMDMTDTNSISRAVDLSVSSFGRLDIAVNNAGIQMKRTALIDIADAQFDEVLNVNLHGAFRALKHEIRAMIDSGGGSIVNIASTAGIVGYPLISPYVASKHGVIGLTKSAALEYASRGVRVNAIVPGTIMTEMLRKGPLATPESEAETKSKIAMQRIGEPREAADAAVWLASDASSYVTGIALPVDGGYTAA